MIDFFDLTTPVKTTACMRIKKVKPVRNKYIRKRQKPRISWNGEWLLVPTHADASACFHALFQANAFPFEDDVIRNMWLLQGIGYSLTVSPLPQHSKSASGMSLLWHHKVLPSRQVTLSLSLQDSVARMSTSYLPQQPSLSTPCASSSRPQASLG